MDAPFWSFPTLSSEGLRTLRAGCELKREQPVDAEKADGLAPKLPSTPATLWTSGKTKTTKMVVASSVRAGSFSLASLENCGVRILESFGVVWSSTRQLVFSLASGS